MEKLKQHQSATKSTTYLNKMKTQNLIAIIVGATLLQYGLLHVNAQAADNQNQTEEPGAEAMKVGDKLKSPDLSLKVSDQSPVILLKNDLIAQGLTEPGWDSAKQRYLQVSEFEVNVEGSFTAEMLVSRLNLANLAMSITAMNDFSKFLGNKTKLEANLSIGGSPVGRIFMKEQERFQKKMDDLEKQLTKVRSKLLEAKTTIDSADGEKLAAQKALDATIAEQEKIVRDLNQRATYGPSTLNRLGIVADILIQKMDTKYSKKEFKEEAAKEKEKLNAEKQAQTKKKDAVQSEKMAAAMKDYDTLQGEIVALVKEISEKKEEAVKFFDEYIETHLNVKYNYRADYDIVGLTPVKYYYGIMPGEKGGQKLVVAGAFAWSPALERGTRAILDESGQNLKAVSYTERFKVSEGFAKKGDKTLGQWLNDHVDQVDTFGPGRSYVDNKGVRYWLGCAYAIKGSGAKANASYAGVRLDAERNLHLSLNVKFQVEGTKTDSMALSETASEIQSSLKEFMSIERSGSDISSEALAGEFTLPLENGQKSQPIRYYISKVSQDDVKAAHKAVLQQAETAARAHETAYRREGVRKGANDFVKGAKDDKTPLGEAYDATKKDLNASKQPAGPHSTNATGKSTATTIFVKPGTNAPTQGNVQPFIKGDKRKVPDDF